MKWSALRVKEALINYFMHANITAMVLVMAGISFASAILGAVILRLIYGENYPELAAAVNLTIALFIFGLVGLAQILRREAPGISPDRPLRGLLAVLYGLFIVIVFWGGSLLALLIALKNHFHGI